MSDVRVAHEAEHAPTLTAKDGPIYRVGERGPPAPAGSIEVASTRAPSACTLEAHLPAGILSGFDPDQHRRIGTFTIIEDTGLGQQPLTVCDEPNWHINPSTWATGILTRE